jgi:hypothetical protein
MIDDGADFRVACESTLVHSLTDDPELVRALTDLISTKIG